MNPLIQCKRPSTQFLIALLLACFFLLPKTHSVSPAPDGGYAGGNTAEGTNALLDLTTGKNNIAVGLNSLTSPTTGDYNTAIGSAALRFNTASYNTAIGDFALKFNTTGVANTATGDSALFDNTVGFENTSVLARSVATPPATTTQPLVRLLSLTTLPVTAILRWEGLPAATSRRPIMLFA